MSRRYFGLTSSAPAAVVAKAPTYLDTRFSATSRQSDALSGVVDHFGVSSVSVVAYPNPSTQDGEMPRKPASGKHVGNRGHIGG